MGRGLYSRRGIGRNETIGAAAVIVVIAIILIPIFFSSNTKSHRAEVELNVNAIRKAQLDHKTNFGDFVSAMPAPRGPLDANADAVAWTPSEGFKKLGWAPAEAEVRGVYSVNAKGDTFKVTGVCDVDADHIQARFEATESEAAKLVTDAAVY